MYNIYFNKRVLKITDNPSNSFKESNSIFVSAKNETEVGHIPLLMESSPNIHNLTITTTPDNIETLFNNICCGFDKIVVAAGGVVENENGDYLMILRNNMWDLPKGKQEENESVETTALREVEEECGISGLELERLICITHHTYRMNGEFILKHTWWYKIRHTGKSSLVPQREENIEEAVWVGKERVNELLANTYPSIIEVFGEL